MNTNLKNGTDGRIVRITEAQRAVEGDGFVVYRPFPTQHRSHIDPFLLLDHMGPTDMSPGEGVGTPWHPHRGFETVTYMLEGEANHQDSIGNRGTIGPGDTQWMTAASGILHKEGPTATTTRLHGLQLWVNLPAADKMGPPAYQDLRASENAVLTTDTTTIRVIAGELFGLIGPGSTRTPISYAHVTLARSASVSTDLPEGHVVLVYPMTGTVSIQGVQVGERTLAEVEGRTLTLTGASDSADVIVLTGRPIGEPVARYGPFVMNTKAELHQAMADFDSGKFGAPAD